MQFLESNIRIICKKKIEITNITYIGDFSKNKYFKTNESGEGVSSMLLSSFLLY